LKFVLSIFAPIVLGLAGSRAWHLSDLLASAVRVSVNAVMGLGLLFPLEIRRTLCSRSDNVIMLFTVLQFGLFSLTV